MDAQIFIVTCERDLGWLEYCLKSIRKYWSSQYCPVIVADNRCEGKMPVETYHTRVHYVAQWSDGRRDQVCWKMLADTFVSADAIFYMDSDCVLTGPCSAESFLVDGKCPVYCRPYQDILSGQSAYSEFLIHKSIYEGYRDTVRHVLGYDPLLEYMQCFPFMFWTDTIRSVREDIEGKTGKALREVALSHPSNHFSEFNLFGAYVDMTKDTRYKMVLMNYHSLHAMTHARERIRQFNAHAHSVESHKETLEKILNPSFGGVVFC